MKMIIFDTGTITDDVRNWDQTPAELAAWTPESMYHELDNIYDDGDIVHEDGDEITLRELAMLYTAAAHELAAELQADDESDEDDAWWCNIPF